MVQPKGIKRYAIMGGTFDPLHYGHLVAAEGARSEFNLDKVIFVPSGNPPHKKSANVTDAKYRYEMTKLAIASNPNFDISRIELEREGPSYTIDTIKEFKKLYGSENTLYFITGADAILEILTWKNFQEVMGLCYFIAATRPGYNLDELKNQLGEHKEFLNKIFYLEVPALAISSTDIRKRIETGKSVKYLVPETVEEYLLKNNIYLLETGN